LPLEQPLYLPFRPQALVVHILLASPARVQTRIILLDAKQLKVL
jgi:hypothetical protein